MVLGTEMLDSELGWIEIGLIYPCFNSWTSLLVRMFPSNVRAGDDTLFFTGLFHRRKLGGNG